MVVEGVDGAVVQIGAGLVQRRGGYAGGQHEAHIHRQILRGLQHILDAVGTHDVGDLVGVGDDRGGAVGQHGLGKLCGADQRALQMDVGVHEAGQHDLTADIHLRDAVVCAHAHDIRRLPSGSHGDDPQFFVELTVDLSGIAFLYRHMR